MFFHSKKKSAINTDSYIKDMQSFLEIFYRKPEPQKPAAKSSSGGGSCKYSERDPDAGGDSCKYSERARIFDREIITSKKDSLDIDILSRNAGSYADSLLNYRRNQSFSGQIIRQMNAQDLRDRDVYKAAHIDRRLFSKIMSNPDYKPSKDTAIQVAFGLKLDLLDAVDLLERAGYALSSSIKRDVVIGYFFRERIYDLDVINAVLYDMDMKPLGG